MAVSICLSIITLNVSELKAPTKRQIKRCLLKDVAEWTKKKNKQNPYICCLQNTHFRSEDTHRLKVRKWKKVFHANGNEKKVGVVYIRQNRL